MTESGFPGGTSVSHLRVYDWPTSDGLAGGSPHLHTASSEGYVVIAGEGAVETLSGAGYRSTPLRPGSLLWFTPGTVHRLINHSGGLELLVVMQNHGLPEAGDAVFTFPPEVLADPDAYASAATLPPQAETDDVELSAAARRRRDLAIDGYLALRERIADEGPRALAGLHEAAARQVPPPTPAWRKLWQQRPLAQAELTGTHLEQLTLGVGDHLRAATVYATEAEPGPRRYGMCGRLRVWALDGARALG